MSKLPIFILVGIIAVVAVVWSTGGDESKSLTDNSDAAPAETLTPINSAPSDDESMDAEVQVESEADTMADTSIVQELPTPEPTELTVGTYEKYSADKVSNADGKVVLFFKADWCPSCRVLDADINKNLGDIPSNVTILEVNYDSETNLKQKYGITTQHTLVYVDNDGNQLKKWSGSPRLSSVLAEI